MCVVIKTITLCIFTLLVRYGSQPKNHCNHGWIVAFFVSTRTLKVIHWTFFILSNVVVLNNVLVVWFHEMGDLFFTTPFYFIGFGPNGSRFYIDRAIWKDIWVGPYLSSEQVTVVGTKPSINNLLNFW